MNPFRVAAAVRDYLYMLHTAWTSGLHDWDRCEECGALPGMSAGCGYCDEESSDGAARLAEREAAEEVNEPWVGDWNSNTDYNERAKHLGPYTDTTCLSTVGAVDPLPATHVDTDRGQPTDPIERGMALLEGFERQLGYVLEAAALQMRTLADYIDPPK